MDNHENNNLSTTPATSTQPSNVAAAPQATSAQQPRGKTDDEVIKDIQASNQGTLFDALMRDASMLISDAMMKIMVLLRIIASFAPDADQVERIFRRGNLVPSWWDDLVERGGIMGIVTRGQYLCRKAVAAYMIAIQTVLGPRYLLDYYADENPRYTTDDIGISRLFSDVFYDILRYVPEKRSWFYFDGRVWAQNNGAAMEYCKLLASAMEMYASQIDTVNMTAFPPDDKAKSKKAAINNQYRKFTKQSKSRRTRETVLKDAQSVYGLLCSASDFDVNPNLLCCENGTLDLRDGSFHAHSPQDMITRMANVSYDPLACSPLWLQHVDTVMDGDQEKTLYFQKCVGSALVGTNKYCCVFILYGPSTRNGKSVTMDTIIKMLGSYGAVSNPETFAQKKTANGSAHCDDLARLAGKRIVSVPEVEKTMTLSSSLVKRVTGDGEITVRAIFEHQVSVIPQFSLFFHTNFLPRVNDMSMFQSGRIKVIPFLHFFAEDERNPNMVAELTTPENLSGILNWALEGLRRIEIEGFEPPTSVLEATGQYSQESDQIGNFLGEHLEKDSSSIAPTRSVFELYRQWCGGCGLHPGREQDFKKDLKNRGITVGRPRDKDGKQVTAYMGWRIVV